MRRSAIALAIGACAAAPAAAREPAPPAPMVGEIVLAGHEVAVAWADLPLEVDEFELLLILDDGARTLRLTPSLEPMRRRHVWRVPNLPAQRARLKLRVGIAGREIEGPASAPFEIVAAPAPASPIRWDRGEWWTAECWEAAPLEPDCFGGNPFTITGAHGSTAVLLPVGLGVSSGAGSPTGARRIAGDRSPARRPPASRVPDSIPLRL